MGFSDREVHAAFSGSAAPLDDPALLEAAGALPAADILKLLEILQNRTAAQKDPGRHVKRVQFFARASAAFGDRSLFLPFIRALKSGDASLRAALVDALPRVNAVENHGELIAF